MNENMGSGLHGRRSASRATRLRRRRKRVNLLVLAAFGVASMWLAVFADVGVAVLAICNAMRMLRAK